MTGYVDYESARSFLFTQHCADLCFSWIMPIIAISFAIILAIVLKYCIPKQTEQQEEEVFY